MILGTRVINSSVVVNYGSASCSSKKQANKELLNESRIPTMCMG